MSAIIIQPGRAPQPSERSHLIPIKSYGTLSRSSSTSSLSSASRDPTRTPHASRLLERSAPLKDSLSRTRFVVVCAGVWSSNFAFAFQSTAIPTLAPAISSGFNHAELSSYLGSIYTLAATGVLPLYGVFMETLGRKFAMAVACFCFGLGTVLCAISPNIYLLIGARAVSGLGGGGMLTVSSVIVTDLVSLRDRGYYQGIMMTIFGSGAMLGGPICGYLTDHYGWQWAFWASLPFIIICATIVTLALPEAPIAPTHKSLWTGLASLDWVGSFLLLGSVTTLILGFSFHTSYLEPWSAPIVWGLLLAATLSFAIFLFVETKVPRPIVPLSLFKSRHRAAVMASGFFLALSNQSFSYLVPVYFVVVCNTSTAFAGMILSVCGGLGLAVGSLIAGQHIRAGGKYRMLGILALVPATFGSWVAAAWEPHWPLWAYYLTYVPMSLGYSMFLCVQLIALISGVDSARMPKATALLYTLRTLGGTLGVSVGGSIQLGSLTSHLRTQLSDVPNKEEIITSILHSKAAIRLLPLDLQTRALTAYANSITTVWIISGCIAVLTVASAWFIAEKDMPGRAAPAIKGSGGGIGDGEFGQGLGATTVEGETTNEGRSHRS